MAENRMVLRDVDSARPRRIAFALVGLLIMAPELSGQEQTDNRPRPIRNDVAQRNPWLLEAVFRAYSRAKQHNFDSMRKEAWFRNSLPWLAQELEETRALMGDNFYSYGIKPNRRALETLFRYSHQQGLSSRKLTIEELFAPGSQEFVEPSA